MNQQQQSRWQPTRWQVLWTLGIVASLTVAVLIGYGYGITLWDWIKLLIVPAVIAGGGLWFNSQQREREQKIASERAQDEALQAYLDHMSGMLIPPSKDLPSLYKARPGDRLRSVARARTLTVLPRLAGDGKARVVQFLYESGLISGGRPVLVLTGANLSEAELSGADLSEAYLGEAVLFRANLRGAYLFRANLRRAYLSAAKLSGADLREADLSEADLMGAVEITNEKLKQEAKSLTGATMPNGQKYEDWLKSKSSGEEE